MASQFLHLYKYVKSCFLIVGFFLIQSTPGLTQNFSWARQQGGVNASTNPHMGQIKFDALGNSYHSVVSTGTIDVDPGPGVLNFTNTSGITKLDPSGNLIWAKEIPGRFELDALGNIYSVGPFSGTKDFDPGPGVFNLSSFGYEDVFIAKYDGAGNFVWAKQVGGAFREMSSGVAVTSERLYVTGSFGYGGNISPINNCDFDPDPVATHILTNAGSYDGFVLSLNLDGEFVSVLQKGTVNEDHVQNIGADAAGNVYYVYRSHLLHYLEKADGESSIVWTKNIPGLEHAPLSVDPAGNVLLSGGYSGTVDFDPGSGVASHTSSTVQDPFVTKFDADGNFIWVRVIKANGFANGNITDAQGNVYTTGYFNAKGNVDFDPGPGVFSLKVSAIATYVQKLNSSGNFVWAVKMGGESRTDCKGRSIGVDNASRVIIAFEFKGKIDVNPGAATNYLTSIGTQDIGIVLMTQSGSIASPLWVEESNALGRLIVYPNPSSGDVLLSMPLLNGPAGVMIFDAGGRVVWNKIVQGNGNRNLIIPKMGASGVYTIVVINENKRYLSKLVIQ